MGDREGTKQRLDEQDRYRFTSNHWNPSPEDEYWHSLFTQEDFCFQVSLGDYLSTRWKRKWKKKGNCRSSLPANVCMVMITSLLNSLSIHTFFMSGAMAALRHACEECSQTRAFLWLCSVDANWRWRILSYFLGWLLNIKYRQNKCVQVDLLANRLRPSSRLHS